jgi:4-amino-4-deoxy-L-arabinose transferase-like glycosyltransferase
VRSWLILLSLAAILLAAALLRFVDLAANPGGLYLDEAAEALDAHRLLSVPGFHPLFFTDGGGREALFGYLVAAAFGVFGETTLVLRATAAAIGVGGVLSIWLLGRRFGAVAGLAAAAWAAGSLWLICISRNGMRNTLVPLFAALCLASLLSWTDRPRRATALAGGAVTALATLYTYQPLKLLPLLLVAWLFWLRRANPDAYRRLRPTFSAFAVSFALVAAPMLLVGLFDPASYFGRMFGVLSTGGGQPVDLANHWLRTLGMFVVTGDPNPRHDVAGLPLLGWPLFILAAIGVVGLWRRRRQPADALILASLPIFLLPPLLATEGGAPHFLRALGLAAPLAVAIGMGVQEVVARSRRRWGRGPERLTAGVAAVGLAALAIASGHAYLSRPIADRYEAYRYDLVALASAADHRSALISDDYSAGVVRFLDLSDLPTIVPPGERIAAPGRFHVVLALRRSDIERALGPSVTASARVVARDPTGRASVWAVSLSP